jgi:DNA transposition AAA+ family ATPase
MSDFPNGINFIITKEHRRFIEFCDACRRYRYVGLCYGPPGVGKTASARKYAHQDLFDHLVTSYRMLDLPVFPEALESTTLLYTPSVTHSPSRLEKDIAVGRRQLNDLHYWMRDAMDRKVVHDLPTGTPEATELIIVDEADRLKAAGLEQMRDIYDRGGFGLVLIGMPGIEKRLARYPQLYSRVGFVHHFRPLSSEEIQFVLQHKWQQLGLNLDLSDFTDAEAVAAITRITNGNFRLVQRLLNQVERVLQINELRYITKEVVEAARELLIIGPG